MNILLLLGLLIIIGLTVWILIKQHQCCKDSESYCGYYGGNTGGYKLMAQGCPHGYWGIDHHFKGRNGGPCANCVDCKKYASKACQQYAPNEPGCEERTKAACVREWGSDCKKPGCGA